MKRREFITLVGGAVAMAPFAARAQPSERVPLIGFLYSQSPEVVADRLRGFHRGLKDAGFVDGENLIIAYRWAENQTDRLPALAAELVRRQVAVIATGGNAAPLAAVTTTVTVPIVFAVNEDPVKLGLVRSLARPGGNATGVNFFSGELVAKRLEMLRELVPATTRVAVLVNPTNAAATETTSREVETSGRAMGLQIDVVRAGTSGEISAVFASFGSERPDALFVASDGFFASRRVQLANLAARHAIPTAFAVRSIAEAGGLMSYGSNIADAWRQAGDYVGRILKGAKPADMPVMQADKFELVINAETARMLGLVISPTLLARADEVIE